MKTKKIILFLIMFTLSLALGFAGGYFLKEKNLKTSGEMVEDTVSKEDKDENIYLTTFEIEELLKNVPDSPRGKNVYKDSNNVNDVDSNLLIIQILKNEFDRCYTYRDCKEGVDTPLISKKFVEDEMKRIYGRLFKMSLEDETRVGMYNQCFDYKDEYFYEAPCVGGGAETLSKLDDYKIVGSDLVVYEYKVAFYTYWGESLEDFTTGAEKVYEAGEGFVSGVAIDYFNEHYTEFTKYKHVFKKGEQGYYWYSTEVA